MGAGAPRVNLLGAKPKRLVCVCSYACIARYVRVRMCVFVRVYLSNSVPKRRNNKQGVPGMHTGLAPTKMPASHVISIQDAGLTYLLDQK